MNSIERLLLCAPLALGACAPGMGVYTRAEVVYSEPPAYEYDAPPDRIVVVTREVLVERGYEVYRVDDDGPNRIIWARRGDEGDDDEGGRGEVVRVFVSRNGDRYAVRGLTEVRERGDNGKHKGWHKKDRAEGLMGEIDRRMRRRGEREDH